jgi:valyl-tRNA synthetase
VHPEDERYKHLVGKSVVVPMVGGRTIPIIADDYVDVEFGTGALKITPGHDPNDYEIGKKQNLPIINIMNKDGSLNANAGDYIGMDRFDARDKLWEDIMAAGLAIKVGAQSLSVHLLCDFMSAQNFHRYRSIRICSVFLDRSAVVR